MKKFLGKKYTAIAASLLGMVALLPSCKDDDLNCTDGMDAVDGFAIQFRIAPLDIDDNDASGVAGWDESYYDNYIDPSLLRVLIFDKTDKFLFEVNEKHIYKADGSIEGDEYKAPRGYYVAMSGKELEKYLSDAGYNTQGTQPIFDENFKVAVLANWPVKVEGRRDNYNDQGAADGSFSDDPFVSNTMIYYDRSFSPAQKGGDGQIITEGDDLFKLSHLAYDNVYGPLVYINGNPTNDKTLQSAGVYDHLVDTDGEGRGKMGVYSVWVKNFHQSRDESVEFVRSQENKDGVTWHREETEDTDGSMRSLVWFERETDQISYKIYNVWRVWNFGLGQVKDAEYNTTSEVAKNYWEGQNQRLIIDKINPENGGDWGNIDGMSFNNGTATFVPYDNGEGGYVSIEECSGANDQNVPASLQNYFRFRSHGEGTVRIKAKGTGKPAVITCPPGTGNNRKGQTELRVVEKDDDPNDDRDIGIYQFKADPSTNEYRDVFIYAEGGPIDIYEIEFIDAMMIYDTDRVGILPSENNPIPMYGVQEFDPIRKYIKPNETFNLSTKKKDIDYNFKSVYLLRSVAKVEVLVRKDLVGNKHTNIAHLAMRSMNRSARCEPLDVWTPTELIYNGGKYTPTNGNEYELVGLKEEIKNIHNFGYFYNRGAIDNGITFPNMLGWYYKHWTDKGWTWNGKNINPVHTDDIESPRIFNARIDRCDFNHFTYMGEKDGYYRYLMYVPEKCSDDPDTKGDLTVTPKICHIDIRFSEMNDLSNLISHGAYRIYFADYNGGKDPFYEITRDNYDIDFKGSTDSEFKKDDNGNYVKDDPSVDNTFINKLQPIVRNCVYTFKVDGLNSNDIKFQVCTPATREAKPIEFD